MTELAVITGEKSFDVIAFHTMFQSFEHINTYIQHLDDFAASPESIREHYDAVLFYFMMSASPVDEGLPGFCGKPRSALEHLSEMGQGIIVLHHALLAYPEWSVWDEIVGMAKRELTNYQHDEKIQLQVADTMHPITAGLTDWVMVDETYQMPDAAHDNQILLTTTHKESMATLAWVRQYKRSRVFCLQPGHDHQAWENKNFRTILKRGIEWSCGKL